MGLIPVTLPPGRLRLLIKPDFTGSTSPLLKMIGISRVTFLAALGAAFPPNPDCRHPPLNQIRGQRRQSIELALCPTVFNQNIPALEITDLSQPLAERGNEMSIGAG